jgi:hypothetical protein
MTLNVERLPRDDNVRAVTWRTPKAAVVEPRAKRSRPANSCDKETEMSHGQSRITGAAPPEFPPGWAEFILARSQFLLARGLETPQPTSRFATGSERGEHEVPTVVVNPSGGALL